MANSEVYAGMIDLHTIAPPLHQGERRIVAGQFLVDIDAPGCCYGFWCWYPLQVTWVFLGVYRHADITAAGGVLETFGEQRYAEWQSAQAQRERDWQEAERRADELARDVLTADEYAHLTTKGWVDVPSKLLPGAIYRVSPQGRMGFVEPHQPRRSACIVLGNSVHRFDKLVALVLAAKYDEQRLWIVGKFISDNR